MSKGNPVVKCRVEVSTWDAIVLDVARKNGHTAIKAYDMSVWLRDAIREKLAHGSRARRRWRKRGAIRWDLLCWVMTIRQRWAIRSQPLATYPRC